MGNPVNSSGAKRPASVDPEQPAPPKKPKKAAPPSVRDPIMTRSRSARQRLAKNEGNSTRADSTAQSRALGDVFEEASPKPKPSARDVKIKKLENAIAQREVILQMTDIMINETFPEQTQAQARQTLDRSLNAAETNWDTEPNDPEVAGQDPLFGTDYSASNVFKFMEDNTDQGALVPRYLDGLDRSRANVHASDRLVAASRHLEQRRPLTQNQQQAFDRIQNQQAALENYDARVQLATLDSIEQMIAALGRGPDGIGDNLFDMIFEELDGNTNVERVDVRPDSYALLADALTALADYRPRAELAARLEPVRDQIRTEIESLERTLETLLNTPAPTTIDTSVARMPDRHEQDTDDEVDLPPSTAGLKSEETDEESDQEPRKKRTRLS